MVKTAIQHENTVRFVYPKSRNTLKFSIRVGREDINNCKLYYFSRNNPEGIKMVEMNWKYRDDLFDYFEIDVTFSKVARYQKYFFSLEDYCGNVEYLSAFGFSKIKPDIGYFEYLYTNEGDLLTVPEWSKGQIFYQIFPERFRNGNKQNDREDIVEWGSKPTRENYMGGDIAGIIEGLDYIKDLGVECLYLTPIFEADFNHKYATTNYFEIDSEFGTKEEFRTLVHECHKRSIKIVLDGVFNHTGTSFAPFKDVLKNQEKSKYKDWFHIVEFPITVSHHSYECVGAYKWMPKLNTSNNEVVEYILNVMEYWITEFGIDGWRLDVADEVDKRVWQSANFSLKEKYPNILLLGETWGYGLNMMQGDQLDSVMNYVFRDSVRDFFALGSIRAEEFDNRINKMLANYFSDAKYSLYNLLDSHDTERFLFLCNEDKRKFKLAVAFQFLFLGSPAIYYGDEVGITGDTDPDCRRAMEWAEDKQDLELLKWYKKLAKIRINEKSIRLGEYATNLCDSDKNAFGFVRYSDEEEVYIVFNNSEHDSEFSIPVFHNGEYQNLITDETYLSEEIIVEGNYYNQDVLVYGGKIGVRMKPYSTKVLKRILGR